MSIAMTGHVHLSSWMAGRGTYIEMKPFGRLKGAGDLGWPGTARTRQTVDQAGLLSKIAAGPRMGNRMPAMDEQ
jgi:hypothetical protein